MINVFKIYCLLFCFCFLEGWEARLFDNYCNFLNRHEMLFFFFFAGSHNGKADFSIQTTFVCQFQTPVQQFGEYSAVTLLISRTWHYKYMQWEMPFIALQFNNFILA